MATSITLNDQDNTALVALAGKMKDYKCGALNQLEVFLKIETAKLASAEQVVAGENGTSQVNGSHYMREFYAASAIADATQNLRDNPTPETVGGLSRSIIQAQTDGCIQIYQEALRIADTSPTVSQTISTARRAAEQAAATAVRR